MQLSRKDTEIVLDAVISAGESQVTLSANSGECSSAIGAACIDVPIGDVVHVELKDLEGTFIADTVVVGVEAGDELFVYTTVDLSADIEAFVLEAPDRCTDLGIISE